MPLEVLAIVPRRARTRTMEVRDALAQLQEDVAARGWNKRDVLSLTLFSSAGDPARYAAFREASLGFVRDSFDGAPPAAGVVCQQPQWPGQVVLEATVLPPTPGATVARRTCAGVDYTLVTAPRTRQVHCHGICSDPRLTDRAEQSRDAFEKMERILHHEGLTFGHVIRQWGYIEGMLDVQADCPLGHQAYQTFNDVRTMAYEGTEFPAGYPAATGIGQSAGGVTLDFIALDAPSPVRVAPMSNPRQTDAHDYSADMLVGAPLETLTMKCTPKFERAKLVARDHERIVFVSGTAAIVGEQSVAPGNVAAQTKTTIENMTALIGTRRLGNLRAYVKRADDIFIVKRICTEAFGLIPAVYVQADVCRDELLVELEGALTGEP